MLLRLRLREDGEELQDTCALDDGEEAGASGDGGG